jgi:hypothetical protein
MALDKNRMPESKVVDGIEYVWDDRYGYLPADQRAPYQIEGEAKPKKPRTAKKGTPKAGPLVAPPKKPSAASAPRAGGPAPRSRSQRLTTAATSGQITPDELSDMLRFQVTPPATRSMGGGAPRMESLIKGTGKYEQYVLNEIKAGRIPADPDMLERAIQRDIDALDAPRPAAQPRPALGQVTATQRQPASMRPKGTVVRKPVNTNTSGPNVTGPARPWAGEALPKAIPASELQQLAAEYGAATDGDIERSIRAMAQDALPGGMDDTASQAFLNTPQQSSFSTLVQEDVDSAMAKRANARGSLRNVRAAATGGRQMGGAVPRPAVDAPNVPGFPGRDAQARGLTTGARSQGLDVMGRPIGSAVQMPGQTVRPLGVAASDPFINLNTPAMQQPGYSPAMGVTRPATPFADELIANNWATAPAGNRGAAATAQAAYRNAVAGGSFGGGGGGGGAVAAAAGAADDFGPPGGGFGVPSGGRQLGPPRGAPAPQMSAPGVGASMPARAAANYGDDYARAAAQAVNSQRTNAYMGGFTPGGAAGAVDDVVAGAGDDILRGMGGLRTWARNPVSQWGNLSGGLKGGIGAAAGILAPMAIRAAWDDPNSSWDDATASAAGWGATGAGIGSMILPGWGTAIGGIGGGLIGGIKGYFDAENAGPGTPEEALAANTEMLDQTLNQLGVGGNVRQQLYEQIQVAATFAQSPEEVDAIFQQAGQLLPSLIAQARQEDEANARYAAIQAAILPLMKQQNTAAQQSSQMAQGYLNQAASVQRDPQVAALLKAQGEQLMANQANYANAAYGQMAAAPMFYDLLGGQVQQQSNSAGLTDPNALLAQLGV